MLEPQEQCAGLDMIKQMEKPEQNHLVFMVSDNENCYQCIRTLVRTMRDITEYQKLSKCLT